MQKALQELYALLLFGINPFLHKLFLDLSKIFIGNGPYAYYEQMLNFLQCFQ